MEKLEILAITIPENSHDTVLSQATIGYVNVTITMETVKAFGERPPEEAKKTKDLVIATPAEKSRARVLQQPHGGTSNRMPTPVQELHQI